MLCVQITKNKFLEIIFSGEFERMQVYNFYPKNYHFYFVVNTARSQALLIYNVLQEIKECKVHTHPRISSSWIQC